MPHLGEAAGVISPSAASRNAYCSDSWFKTCRSKKSDHTCGCVVIVVISVCWWQPCNRSANDGHAAPQALGDSAAQTPRFAGPHAGVAAGCVDQQHKETAAVALIVEMDAVDVRAWHDGPPALNQHGGYRLHMSSPRHRSIASVQSSLSSCTPSAGFVSNAH
jgi:hypothetical protein